MPRLRLRNLWRSREVSSYAFRVQPYAHQRRAIKKLLRSGYGGALLMEPRTGKTKTTVDWLSILNQQGKIDSALIVCPNRVMNVWVREFLAHSPRRVHLTVWDKDERKLGAPRRPVGYDLYVVITNYETFGQPSRKKTPSGKPSKSAGRFKHRQYIRKWLKGATGACVLDESHKIKSPSGSASNMLVSMRDDFPFRAILTGTPLTKAKRTHDIYMQWQFLNPSRFYDLPTSSEFKAHYGRWLSQGSYSKYLGPANLPELHARMVQDSVIVRRDQCFDLPPREDIIEYVDLVSSRKVYEQMAAEMIARLENGAIAEAGLTIVQALRLSQITSGFVTDDTGEIHRIGFEKYDRLVELVSDRLEMEQKIVVVARWKADLDLIEAFGKEMQVPTFSVRGKVKRAVSDKAIDDFRELTTAGIMVLQPQAASLGIDLSTASHMVWYSHTPSWVDFTQCCDRIALSRTSTTFSHIVARKSVDEMCLATLAQDGDIARAMMSNPGELLNGHPLDLDDYSRLQGVGSFQFRKGKT